MIMHECSSSMYTWNRLRLNAEERPFVDERSPTAQGRVSMPLLQGLRLKDVFHSSLATTFTALLTTTGKGLRRRLSLDQDPSTTTAQIGPDRGTQMHKCKTPPVTNRASDI